MNRPYGKSEMGSATVSAPTVGVTPTDPNKQCARRDVEHSTRDACAPQQNALSTELLILPDGQILVHNLTQPFAELLRGLNPNDEQISSRAAVTKAVGQASSLPTSSIKSERIRDRQDACPTCDELPN